MRLVITVAAYNISNIYDLSAHRPINVDKLGVGEIRKEGWQVFLSNIKENADQV